MPEKPVVWIDFENAPHVWVLKPIVERLQEVGYRLRLTARDFSYTVTLCQRLGYPVEVVGRTGPVKGTAQKALRIFERAAQLVARLVPMRGTVHLALSHGSRSQLLAAATLGIPSITMDDYEKSDQTLAGLARHILAPFPIPKETWGRFASRVVHYPGLKEELYLADFRPPADLPAELQPYRERVRILIRPEGHFSHYHSDQSTRLQAAILEYVAQTPSVFLILLPRESNQRAELTAMCDRLGLAYWLPDRVLDGRELIAASDLVIGGGGTMTREAAVLGVPAYSFFAGEWGAVDQYLVAQGRLVRIAESAHARQIRLQKRAPNLPIIKDDARRAVTGFIEQCLVQR